MNKSCLYSLLLYAGMMACAKKNIPPAAVQSGPATWYVSPSGSDGNPGTLSAPFASVTAGLNKAHPGDTVLLRAGTYYGAISFPFSGNEGQRITLKSYPGERAILDGSNLTPTGWQALVTIKDRRYLTLEGLDICNLMTSSGSVDVEGMSISGASHDITVSQCHIYNIKNSSPLSAGRSGHAILVLGNDNQTAITGLRITGCTVHDTWTGTSENVTLAGNVDSFSVDHDTLYHTENIGIIVAGGDNLNPSGATAVNYARNGNVSDNLLYDISMANSASVWGQGNYGAIAIYICGGAGTVVERNKIYNSDRGIGLVSESNIYPTQTSIVRNNFVAQCWRTGIYMGDYLNFTGRGTKNCSVVNNTLCDNDRAPGAFGEIEGELRLTEHCDSNLFANNLVYGRDTDVFVHKYTTTGAVNILSHNLYYTHGTPGWIWQTVNGPAIGGLVAWQAVCGSDTASLYGDDPLLISLTAPDLHIQPGSPAKNTGLMLPATIIGNTDIDGQARSVNGRVSIGAQQ